MASPRKALRFIVLLCILAGTTFFAGSAFAASPGDPTIDVPIGDSTSGASYTQTFEKVYEDTTTDGTDVYIYVPEGAIGDPSVDSMSPQFDPDPSDEFDPCATTPESDYVITQGQIDQLGNQLRDQIVRIDEEHYGPMGGSESLVTLVYNVQDDSYYDCEETTYTAGYFAPEYLGPPLNMNVMVVDAFDWANRVGPQTGNPDGLPFLYEGVIAHELEHLLMEYSDTTEVSWVDEGLADMAIFLNQYPAGGSHVAYHQVFHRETSLNRWGGGLENYGASFTYFLYLWERAGGNGDGTLAPDGEYDDAGGDKLIKLIFQNGADDFDGVQAAINAYNAGADPDLPSARDLFKDWVVAIYRDQAGSKYNFANLDLGGEDDSWGWTIDLANSLFWGDRGIYKGAMPEPRWRKGNVPAQVALPYGTSYEMFTNPGSSFGVNLDAPSAYDLVPPTGTSHWWGGFSNNSEHVLDVQATVSGGETLTFDAWYFIEEGWDYGYVEAYYGGDWHPIPVTSNGVEITTNDPGFNDQNDGNGITGTSGGAYFVDEPKYIPAQAVLPAGTTDVRFRYSTDAAYLDTGWFVSRVNVNGAGVTLSSTQWQFVDGSEQDNNWVAQVIAPCDLTPGATTAGESESGGVHVYRFEGDSIDARGFSTKCLKQGSKASVTVAISNLPTGTLSVFDQPYVFRVANTGSGSKS